MKTPMTVRGLAMMMTLVLALADAPLAVAWAEPAGPLPDAPSAVAQNAQENSGEQSQSPAEEAQPAPAGSQAPAPMPRPGQAPAGAAGAQEGETAGGAASRPAGTALAPAKQRQTRSLLIKVGMIAAAGAAVGTIFALTRGTSSVPPGAPR
jgi:hypothetical protein